MHSQSRSYLDPVDLELLPRAQWRALIQALPWSIAANLGAAATMAVYLTFTTLATEAVAWGMAVAAANMLRLVHLRAAGRKAVIGRKPKQVRLTILAGLAVAGVLWGGGALWFMPNGGFAVEAMFCCFAVGLSAGAAASLNAVRWAPEAISLPLLASILPVLMLDGSVDALAMAAAVTVFALCMYGVGSAGHRSTARTIRMWLGNRRLNRNLRRAQQSETSAQLHARESEAGRRQAEAVATAKARFLGMVGHELRTPLNGVIGFANMIERQVLGPVGDDQYAEYAQEIGRCGGDLRRLIDKIMLFAAASKGEQAKSRRRVELDMLCKSVEHDVLTDTVYAGRRIIVDAPAGLAALGDARLLAQMLRELVENGLKFSPADAPVRIMCRPMGESGVRLSVRDEGAGIPPDKLFQVMEPFVQVDQTYARDAEGIGLGLPLVQHFVDLHGGDLRMTNAIDGGLIVEIFLTADLSSSQAPPAAA